jgi:hypothetical protein
MNSSDTSAVCSSMYRTNGQSPARPVCSLLRRPRLTVLLAMLVGLAGCVGNPTTTHVSDNARDLNQALRFGRTDVAMSLTEEAARDAFRERHAQWGQGIVLMDYEIVSMSMTTPMEAEVQVDYQWTRADESTLRTTRVAQAWSSGDSGWRMTRERRIAGDVGLFGEVMPLSQKPAGDRFFPSRTIR